MASIFVPPRSIPMRRGRLGLAGHHAPDHEVEGNAALLPEALEAGREEALQEVDGVGTDMVEGGMRGVAGAFRPVDGGLAGCEPEADALRPCGGGRGGGGLVALR